MGKKPDPKIEWTRRFILAGVLAAPLFLAKPLKSQEMPVVEQTKLKEMWNEWSGLRDGLYGAPNTLVERAFRATFERVMGAPLPAIVRAAEGDIIAHGVANDPVIPGLLCAHFEFSPELMLALGRVGSHHTPHTYVPLVRPHI